LAEVKTVLQTLASNDSYRPADAFGEDPQSQSLNLGHYFETFKRRFFFFLLPFGVVSVLGLYIAALQKPNYLSEGKILVDSQSVDPNLVRLMATTEAGERIQLIQQRILTRENLLSIASKFGLFSKQVGVLDLMRKSTQIKPAEAEGQFRQGTGATATAFTVGFEYQNPEVAMRVANEFVTMILNEDERTRTARSTEAVKILTAETKEIEDKLLSTQMQISEIARHPHDAIPEISEQQKSQVTALAELKAELIQKSSIYSESHPAVIALKKRIAAMEKSLTQPVQSSSKAPSTDADDIETLKRQRDALEKRLTDANGRLATAQLKEKIDREQQFGSVQVIESPSLPQKPEKSGRLKLVGLAFAAAVALGIGTVVAAELLDGSIRGRHQLLGVVPGPLIVSIPYFETRTDIIRARLRLVFAGLSLVLLLAVLGGLAAAIVLGVPVDVSSLGKAVTGLRTLN
jgi:protein tyrosine kinase modulator